jgi:hypothetical protein
VSEPFRIEDGNINRHWKNFEPSPSTSECAHLKKFSPNQESAVEVSGPHTLQGATPAEAKSITAGFACLIAACGGKAVLG